MRYYNLRDLTKRIKVFSVFHLENNFQEELIQQQKRIDETRQGKVLFESMESQGTYIVHIESILCMCVSDFSW